MNLLKKHQFKISIFLIVSALLLSVLFYWDSNVRLRQFTESQMNSFINEFVKHRSDILMRRLAADRDSLYSFAKSIPYLEDNSEDTLAALLEQYTEDTNFERLFIGGTTPFAMNSLGQISDISLFGYFEEVMAGNSVITDYIRGNRTGQPIILSVVPIFSSDKSAVTGFIGGVYNKAYLQQLLPEDTSGEYKETYVLINRAGDVLASSSALIESESPDTVTNLFDLLQGLSFDEGSFDSLKESFLASDNRFLYFKTSDKTGYYINSNNLLINDWQICTILPEEAVTTNLHFLHTLQVEFLVKFILIFLVLAAYSIFLIHDHAEEKNLKLRLMTAEEANVAKTRFFSNMSHEMRTPMNAIIGLAQLMSEDASLPDSTKQGLQKILSSSNYLLTLINDVLDLSKIESSGLQLSAEPISLKDLLNEINTIIRVQAENKEISFLIQSDYNTGYNLLGDEKRIKQILINLLSNAVKYTPAGGSITLRVEEKLVKNDYSYFLFQVSDTGIGISAENLSLIFEPFEQIKDANRHNVAGTGLGLAISRQLAKEMGGDIQVQSKPGTGSIFTFSVYLEHTLELPENTTACVEETALCKEFPDKRILLVEDNDLNLTIALAFLQKFQLKTEVAKDGKEAVAKFLEHPSGYYDLILMDIIMPVMNGLDACAKIRSSSAADAQSIPIVALSANAFKEDIAKSLSYGMNEHLTKPFSADELLRTLNRYLK